MSTEAVLNLIFSIITALVAVVALLISVIQIQKSNKQSLFDRRLRIYITVKWMKALCDQHERLLQDYLEDANKGPIPAIHFLFLMMTNCTALEEIQVVIHHTLEEEYQRKYLIKMEELRNVCEEARLIFSDDIGHKLANFIYCYEEMLVAIYRYQVAINCKAKECRDNKEKFPSNNELENKQRALVIKYVGGTFKLSKDLENDGTFEKTKKAIRL